MNPLHEGTGFGKDEAGLTPYERDRIESVDLSSMKEPVAATVDEHLTDSHGYSTVATTTHGSHVDPPMAPSRLPEGLQNALERVFKLKKRGTTFEVTFISCLVAIPVLYDAPNCPCISADFNMLPLFPYTHRWKYIAD